MNHANRGQEIFCYCIHPENDFTTTIIIMPEDYVEGWKFEDYLANGFKIFEPEKD